MIEIDGSYGEGGGQIVRTALALSTMTGKPFEIKNIRQGRANPGLKAQHSHCIKALEMLAGAKAGGGEVGSLKLRYIPGAIKPQNLSIDIGTAGSVSLLLQSIVLPLVLAKRPSRLKITGGTDTRWAIPFDYFKNVFLVHLLKYAAIDSRIIRRGYYPKGGGRIDLKIKPKESDKKIDLVEQGRLIQIKGISHASLELQKAQVAERQARTAKLLLSKLSCPVEIRAEYCNTESTGSGITLWAIFSKDAEEIDYENPVRIGSDSLGEKGKRAEDVGKEAAEMLLKEIESKAPVDQHLADNLIPFLALKGQRIKVSQVSDHTLTNIYVCERFLGRKISVKENIIETKPF